MRIVSRLKDFYDKGMGLDEDRALSYIREPKEEKHKRYPFPVLPAWSDYGSPSFSNFCIGFCGLVYCGLRFYKENKPVFCYTEADVLEFLKRKCNKRERTDFENTKKDWYRGHTWALGKQKAVAKFFEQAKAHKTIHHKWFKDIPVFVAEPDYGDQWTIEYNALLRPYEFFRVMHPYQAYQEISMFLNNVAEPRKNIPAISNEDMIQAKGFDLVTSFRKPSSKKRK